MSGASLITNDAIDPLIHKGYLEELASAYAGAADRRDPLISPLFSDLRGFPPVLTQVGAAETLLDDAVRFTRAAGAADVAVAVSGIVAIVVVITAATVSANITPTTIPVRAATLQYSAI
jgi:acetyl esterase/lipase